MSFKLPEVRTAPCIISLEVSSLKVSKIFNMFFFSVTRYDSFKSELQECHKQLNFLGLELVILGRLCLHIQFLSLFKKFSFP